MSSNNLSHFSQSLWLTLGIFVVFGILFAVYVHSEKQIDRAYELRLQSHLLADELRQSSDDLTRMVRTYVETGKAIYKQQYQEILDIRDGKKPRPVNYHDIFWDLVLIDNKRPRPDSEQQIALLDLMRQASFTTDEFAKLAQAKANSDTLTSTEYAAMKLVESTKLPTDAKRLKASQMLHGTTYHQAKAEIMRPISEFYQMMECRTLNDVHSAKNTAIYFRVAFVLSGLLLIFLLWRAYQSLHAVLGSSVDELHGRITRLGRGDFSSAIPVVPGMENSIQGWLSETQIRLAKIDSQRREAEAKSLRMTQLYIALSQCNQFIVRCSNEEELFPQICRDVVTYGGLKMAWIGLLDEQRKQFKPIASYGSGTEYLEGIQISIDENELAGQGPTGTSMRENRPFWCQNFLHDPATAKWHEQGAKFGWGASAALPLHKNGIVIGCFTVYSSEINALDQATQNLLVEMTMDIDYAINNFEREKQRRHAEILLEDSHHLLKSILDVLPAQIVLLDRQGTIQATNRHWDVSASENGLLPAKVGIGFNYLKVCHNVIGEDMEDARYVFDGISHVLNGTISQFNHEYLYHRPDSMHWYRMHVVPLITSRQTDAVVMHIDITENRLAEQLLQEREEEFRALVENSPDVIIRMNKEYRVLYVNPIIESILGIEANRVIGQTIGDFGFPHSMQISWRETIQTVFETGVARALEFNYPVCQDVRHFHSQFVSELNHQGDVGNVLVLIRDITESKTLEIDLDKSRQLLRELAAQNELTREQERKRIAREVHDELGQTLTVLRMEISMLRLRFKNDNLFLLEKIGNMIELIDRAIISVRNVATHLRPAALDMGLVAALEWLCKEFTDHTGIPAEFHTTDEAFVLDETRSVMVFRIAQESLTNCARYAEATRICIKLDRRDENLLMEVRDNGIGFDENTLVNKKSFGLLSIRERTTVLGGEVNIISKPGQGTLISLLIPIRVEIGKK